MTDIPPPPRRCGTPRCDKWISGDDSHSHCVNCMGVGHAYNALYYPEAPDRCPVCADGDDAYLQQRLVVARTLAGIVSREPSGSFTYGRLAPGPHRGIPEASAQAARTSGTGGASLVPRQNVPPPSAAVDAVPDQRHPAQLFTGPPTTSLSSALLPPSGGLLPLVDLQSTSVRLPHSPFHSDVSADDDVIVEDEDGMGEDEEVEEDEEEFPSYQEDVTERDVVMRSPRQGGDSQSTVSTTQVSGAQGQAAAAALNPPLPLAQSVSQLTARRDTGKEDGATAPGGSTDPPEPEPVSAIFERAAARCNLSLQVEERQDSATPAPFSFLGLDPAPPRAPRFRKLPVATGFQPALSTSWQRHQDPPKLPFSIDIAGAADLGIASFPPMDATLAQSFHGQFKKSDQNPFVLGAEPTFADPKERAASKANKNVYRAVALTARSLNAAALVQGSLSLLLRGIKDKLPPETAAEVDSLMQLAINLNVHAIQWTGRSMDNCVSIERARWLERVKFTSQAGSDPKKHLMGLELDPHNLFGGALDFLRDSTETSKAQKEVADTVLQPPPPPPSTRAPRTGRPADRGRSSSRQGRTNYSRPAPSASPVGSNRPRSQVGAVRRRDDRPPPPKPAHRYGPTGPRRGGKGK